MRGKREGRLVERGTRTSSVIPYVPDATPEASLDPLLTDYIRRELEKIQDAFAGKVDGVDAIFPVGAIWISAAATDPNELFPNTTWALISAGTFLASAGGTGTYALGATGGQASVALTEAQMPSHSHSTKMRQDTGNQGSPVARIIPWSDGVFDAIWNRGTATNPMEPVGGGQAHENRPPYLAVNMWRRTA